jgi:methionyl-tRNA formyltransferase
MGEKKTGLSAMKMDEGLDTGPVLFQEETRILSHETAGGLHDRLAAMTGDFALKTMELLKENRIEERPQDDAISSYAPKIERNMSKIDWSRPVGAIEALMRGLDPWPGAFSTLQGRDIKLFSPRSRVENRSDPVPGRVIGFSEGLVEIETEDGVLGVGELQAPGKKRLQAVDFLRGFRIEEGALFEG